MGIMNYAKYAKQAEQAMNMAQSAYNKHQSKPASQSQPQSHSAGQNYNQGQQGQYGGNGGQTSNPYSSYPGARPSAPAPNPGPPPSLQELNRWFDYFDADRSGSLDREEVVNALVQTTGNYGGMQSMRDTVYGVWSNFDRDHSGGIDKREFLMPGGLGESLQSMYGQNSGHRDQMPPAPQQQQEQPQYQMMRAQIPAGMGPGQGLRVRSPYTGQLLQVTIPQQHNWVHPQAGGPPAFDFKVPTAPMPAMATATAVPTGGAGAAGSAHGYGANNVNTNAAPQPHMQHNPYGPSINH